jgi:hypothetical protein
MLEKAYLTPSHTASFSSAQKLRAGLQSKKRPSKRGQNVRIPSLKQIQLWLQEKRPYTLHRPARKRYEMKKVIVGGVNLQLQIDLVDMQAWAAMNDGFRYILLAIDCFSRFGYAQPLKTKQGGRVAVGLEKIITEAEKRIDRNIKFIQADQGLEFYNKDVKALLDRKFITLFSTKSPTKAQMAERLIRTLRSRQERYNTFQGKRRWVESFPQLLKSYNKTIHSSLPLRMSPADVNLKNERQVWKHLYGAELLKTPKSLQKKLLALRKGRAISLNVNPKHLNVGDPVRLSKRKHIFEKAYYQNFTDEIFFVAHTSHNTQPPTFRVADVDGELLEGVFYREELTPVRFDNVSEEKHRGKGAIYAVENVLKEEVRKDGKKYLFVKWRGYPASQNAWIRADQFMSIKNAS